MTPRFLVPGLGATSELVTLPSDEAHHAARVMRLCEGDAVVLFDGFGLESLARIERIGRGEVLCHRGPVTATTVELASRLTLVQSALTGGGLDVVVRDATMLGVSRIEVVGAARSQVSARTIVRRNLVARWERVAVASAKQCGRAVVPELHVWQELDEALCAPRTGVRLLLVEPTRVASGTWRPDESGGNATNAHILVGPEGGWTPTELERATAHGWRSWCLGRRTLRAETAGCVSLAILQYLWDAQEPGPGTGRDGLAGAEGDAADSRST